MIITIKFVSPPQLLVRASLSPHLYWVFFHSLFLCSSSPSLYSLFFIMPLILLSSHPSFYLFPRSSLFLLPLPHLLSVFLYLFFLTLYFLPPCSFSPSFPPLSPIPLTPYRPPSVLLPPCSVSSLLLSLPAFPIVILSLPPSSNAAPSPSLFFHPLTSSLFSQLFFLSPSSLLSSNLFLSTPSLPFPSSRSTSYPSS